MDCNDVFMILTRGPFPTGEASDEDVEAHLETCGDCWRLAEALRPALDVFQEAIPPAESRDLPGYWGDARPASEAFAQLTSGASRTALAAGIRLVGRSQAQPQRLQPPAGLSADFLRGAALAATMTAAAIALALLLRW